MFTITFTLLRKEAQMTTTRKASAVWDGNLVAGKGSVSLDSSKAGTLKFLGQLEVKNQMA